MSIVLKPDDYPELSAGKILKKVKPEIWRDPNLRFLKNYLPNVKKFFELRANKIRSKKYTQKIAHEDVRRMNKDIDGEKLTDRQAERFEKKLAYVFTKEKLKEIRENENKNKGLSPGQRFKIGPDGKPYQVVSRHSMAFDPASAKYRVIGRNGIFSIFNKKGSGGSVAGSPDRGWFTYSGMDKSGKLSVVGKVAESSFAGGIPKAGGASAGNQFGNENLDNFSSMQKLPGADHLNNLPNKPDDYHQQPIKLVS
jgi:hypothetical protein